MFKKMLENVIKGWESPLPDMWKDPGPARIKTTDLHTKKWYFSERHWIEWNSDSPTQLNLCNAAFVSTNELSNFILALKEARDYIEALLAEKEIAK